jgi:hypothetical protein
MTPPSLDDVVRLRATLKTIRTRMRPDQPPLLEVVLVTEFTPEVVRLIKLTGAELDIGVLPAPTNGLSHAAD